MRSLRTLASAASFLLAGFGVAAAAPTRHVAEPNDATIVALSVVSATGRADVVVRVDGNVTLKHFTLSNPDKIVVDLTGATLGLPAGDSYDGVPRGGITRVRYSQFTKSVVRVVLTLDAPHKYDVTQEKGEVRVSVADASEKFESWRIGQTRDTRRETRDESAAQPAQSTQSTNRFVFDSPTETATHRVVAEMGQTRQGTAADRRPEQQQSQEPRITVNFE